MLRCARRPRRIALIDFQTSGRGGASVWLDVQGLSHETLGPFWGKRWRHPSDPHPSVPPENQRSFTYTWTEHVRCTDMKRRS